MVQKVTKAIINIIYLEHDGYKTNELNELDNFPYFFPYAYIQVLSFTFYNFPATYLIFI